MSDKEMPFSVQQWYCEQKRGDNLENWGTIITRTGVSGVHSIQSLTDEGWLCGFVFTLNERDRDQLNQAIYRFNRDAQSWPPLRLPTISFTPRIAFDATSRESDDFLDTQWAQSQSEVLARLEEDNVSAQDRIAAVLFAEPLTFRKNQKPRLVQSLLSFIDANRFSIDDEVITAVGAAIRKLAMNMDESEFETYAELLVPTTTESLSCEIELELAKAIVWRLSKANDIQGGEYPKLEDRMAELASDYLKPRLVLQKNYASIVIHAVIATVLLNSDRKDDLISRITNLRIDWFTELFKRRIGALHNKKHPSTNLSHT